MNRQAMPDPGPSWQMLLVQQLAADVSSGDLELPSFPDVVIRIRQVLSEDDATVEQIARVVGTEPALAARMLRIANSAALNPGGRPVTDLRMAITRVGQNVLRSSALSCAIEQIRRSDGCRDIADEAMLAGLLHSIGKIYILTRAAGHRAIAGNEAALAEIMVSWHANIGKAVLESWGIPEEICDAVAVQDEVDEGRHSGRIGLAEVLATGAALADHFDDPGGLELAVSGSDWFRWLGLDVPACQAVLADLREEILELRQLLGG